MKTMAGVINLMNVYASLVGRENYVTDVNHIPSAKIMVHAR